MVGVIPLKSLKINGNENQGDQVADWDETDHLGD
jgi:hypothetical protein